jgi:hypothetical protein
MAGTVCLILPALMDNSPLSTETMIGFGKLEGGALLPSKFKNGITMLLLGTSTFESSNGIFTVNSLMPELAIGVRFTVKVAMSSIPFEAGVSTKKIELLIMES